MVCGIGGGNGFLVLYFLRRINFQLKLVYCCGGSTAKALHTAKILFSPYIITRNRYDRRWHNNQKTIIWGEVLPYSIYYTCFLLISRGKKPCHKKCKQSDSKANIFWGEIYDGRKFCCQ